jgi:HEAT repeat protein
MDWQELAAKLQTGTPDEAWDAARALADAPQSAPALGAALTAQTDQRLREAIFTSLARHNSPAAFAVLLQQLRCDDAQRRSGALAAMALMPGQVTHQLAALLHDEDPDIRILACDLARHIPAAATLGAILATEPSENVCGAAIDVLADIGTPAECAALTACAARFHDKIFLKFSIKTAIERITARNGA